MKNLQVKELFLLLLALVLSPFLILDSYFAFCIVLKRDIFIKSSNLMSLISLMAFENEIGLRTCVFTVFMNKKILVIVVLLQSPNPCMHLNNLCHPKCQSHPHFCPDTREFA